MKLKWLSQERKEKGGRDKLQIQTVGTGQDVPHKLLLLGSLACICPLKYTFTYLYEKQLPVLFRGLVIMAFKQLGMVLWPFSF